VLRFEAGPECRVGGGDELVVDGVAVWVVHGFEDGDFVA
jgi:hypothetical protein